LRIFYWIVVIPVAIFAVIFALSNREPVSFDLWPIYHPVEMPPFVAVFVGLLAGLFVGGLAAWTAGHKWRQLARARDQELRRARRDLARMGEGRPPPADGDLE
jgi:uncharacterized integral membrane protein